MSPRLRTISPRIHRKPQRSGLEQVFGAVEGLAEFPEMGKPGRDVTTPGIRELVLGNFRVFYEITSTVDILTIRRASPQIDENELKRQG